MLLALEELSGANTYARMEIVAIKTMKERLITPKKFFLKWKNFIKKLFIVKISNSQDTKISNQKEHLMLHLCKYLYLSSCAIFLFLYPEQNHFQSFEIHKEEI